MAAAALPLMAITAAQGALAYTDHQRAAKAAAAQGNYAAGVGELNASRDELQASDAIARGTQASQRAEGQSTQLRGAQRAAFAAGGLDVNAGSSVDVQQSDATVGAMDALTIRANAAREAWGFETQASIDRAEGQLGKFSGQNEAASQRAQAWGTLLTTGASLYGQAYQARADQRKP